VAWERPKVPFLLRLPIKGFPTRRARWCCEEMKEGGGSGRMVVTGIRWAESNKRATRMMVERCNGDPTKTYLHPIIDWKSEDVWEFIRSRNPPYCRLYDEGWTRIGCMFCPMQSARDKRRAADRYPVFERAFRRAFHRMWESRGDRPSFARWKDADDCFDWWLSNEPLPGEDEDQCPLFT
jgi:phosphoadenosine phosphosulfate reductase